MPETPATPAEAAPATGPAATPDTAPATGPEVTPEGEAALGDPGKKALDAMKSKWHSERDRAAALEARLAELEGAKPAKTPEPATEAAKPSDADRKLNARIIRAEIKAAAAGKFADPDDALVYLKDKSRSFKVDENGEVDPAEITSAIEDLLTRKPHLAASGRPRFQGSGDGGAAGREAGPSQLTRADLKGKSPEWVAEAKAQGRLNKLLGITN